MHIRHLLGHFAVVAVLGEGAKHIFSHAEGQLLLALGILVGEGTAAVFKIQPQPGNFHGIGPEGEGHTVNSFREGAGFASLGHRQLQVGAEGLQGVGTVIFHRAVGGVFHDEVEETVDFGVACRQGAAVPEVGIVTGDDQHHILFRHAHGDLHAGAAEVEGLAVAHPELVAIAQAIIPVLRGHVCFDLFAGGQGHEFPV